MKKLKSLSQISGGLLNISYDFRPSSSHITFQLNEKASSMDIEFATKLYSGLTGTEYETTKEMFLSDLASAIKKKETRTICISTGR